MDDNLISKWLVVEFLVLLAVSLVAAIFSYEAIAASERTIGFIVTVYSVLAGFLVAVITLVGDPSSLPMRGGWRSAQLASDLIEVRLYKQKNLFQCYMTVLVLVFIDSFFVADKCYLKDIIQVCYLTFAYAACYYTFKLPNSLIQLQRERINNEIDARRLRENIKKN